MVRIAVMTLLLASGALAQSNPEIAKQIETLYRADDADAKQIEEIFNLHGVPTAKIVGRDAAEDFLTLVGRWTDPPFMRKALIGYQEAASRGDVPPSAVVFLKTRIPLKRAERQREKPPANPELRDRINNLYKEDQALREGGRLDNETFAADARHAPILQSIFDEFGVPSFDLVGREAANHFVIMILHQSPEFRLRVLPKLKENVDRGQASGIDYSMVYDRSQTDQGKLQVYGGNFICSKEGKLVPAPMIDPEHVDDRRAEIGLEPLGAYARTLHSAYSDDVPVRYDYPAPAGAAGGRHAFGCSSSGLGFVKARRRSLLLPSKYRRTLECLNQTC